MAALGFKYADEEMWVFWDGLFREGDKLVIECVLSVNMYSQAKLVCSNFYRFHVSHSFKIPHKISSVTQPKGQRVTLAERERN